MGVVRNCGQLIEREGGERRAADDLGLPVSEQRFRAEHNRRVRRELHCLVEKQRKADTGPLRIDRDRVDVADADAAVRDVVPFGELRDRLESHLDRDERATKVGTLEPERSRDGDHARHDDHRADEELPAPIHDADSSSSGLPSINAFTTGSSVARISSGVPSQRTVPS